MRLEAGSLQRDSYCIKVDIQKQYKEREKHLSLSLSL